MGRARLIALVVAAGLGYLGSSLARMPQVGEKVITNHVL